MKKLTHIAAILMVVNSLSAQWIQQNSGTTNYLNSVYFTDSNTGYAVGFNGTILKTMDGGENWISQNSGTTNHLESVFFIDQLKGFAVGYTLANTLLKTINGGEDWMVDTIHGGSSVFFPDSNTGYIPGGYISGGEVIWKTTDGGNSWSYLQNSSILKSVFFLNADNGYGIPMIDFGPIYHTTDGGNNWITQYSAIGGEGYMNSIYFTSIDTGFVVGVIPYFGIILKTVDGGINWSYELTGSCLRGIHFPTQDIGYIVGDNGLILKTIDGGNYWDYIGNYTNDDLTSVFFPVADTGYIVGSNGIILKTTNGGTVGTIEKEINPDLLNCYPNPFNSAITIEYELTFPENFSITIYDHMGVRVEVIEQHESQGKQQFIWNTKGLPAGLYFCRVQVGNETATKKILKTK